MADKQRNKLTAELEKQVLAKAAEGETAQTIADWLKAEHGIEISRQAIVKRLKATREERAEVARVVTRQVLGKSVTSDLELFQKKLEQANKLCDKLYEKLFWAFGVVENSTNDEPLSPDAKPITDKILDMAHAIVATYPILCLKASQRIEVMIARKLKLSGADPNEDSAAKMREAQQALTEKLDSMAVKLRAYQTTRAAATPTQH